MNLLVQPSPDGPWSDLLLRVYTFILNFLTMLLIVAIGIAFGWAVKRLLQSLLRATKFDRFGHRVGFTHALKKAGIAASPSGAVVTLVYWVILFSFLMLALYALQVQALEGLINDFFALLPKIIAALVILFMGHLLSLFLARTVLLTAVNAGIQFARLLALGVQLLVLFFFIAMALTHIGIATGIVVATFSILLGGVVLALALAFGLAGRDLAKDLLDKRVAKRTADQEEQKEFEDFHPL